MTCKSKLINAHLENAKPVLVVDLDNCLVRAEVLFETFDSTYGHNWKSFFLSLTSFLRGRATLTQKLANLSAIDVSALPYDLKVIALIREWRESGGRTALITTSDSQIAEAVAQYFDLFDEVHGSDEALHLRETNKAEFLVSRFGDAGFVYVGNHADDVAVWKQSAKAITVNASPSLRRDVELHCRKVEHLETKRTATYVEYLREMRPHQWLKNTLVFVPMLASHRLDAPVIFSSLLAFLCFSLIASSVYILNDLHDLSADRAHPRKRRRPIAAGEISIGNGLYMATGLLALGAILSSTLGLSFVLIIVGYYTLTLAYSLELKKRIVVDIFVLASLYTIRTVAGGAATGIHLSLWLLAFSVFFFLALAAVKRQAELIDSAKRGHLKANGRGYHVDDLPIISMIAISAGYGSVLVMMMYVNSPEVLKLYAHPEALWGVCVVLFYWITRTVMIAHRGEMNDDPVVFAAKDRVSLVCLLITLGIILTGSFA